MVCLRASSHESQCDKLGGIFTYANIVEMIHDEEDDQGERLINEGMRRPLETEILFNMLMFNRIQDVEEEQPFPV